MKLFKKANTGNSQTVRRPNLMPGQGDDYVFRRSRTLTGTTSAAITASAEHNSQLKTTRLQAHELHGRKRHLARLLAVSAGLSLLLLALILNFIGVPRFVAAGPGTAAIPSAAYRQSLDDYFAGHPLQRFGLFLNRQGLASYMMAKHGELRSFAPDTGLVNLKADFTVGFRQPVLAWQAGGQRFLVDDNGVAFTYDFYRGDYVAVTDESGLPPEAGGAVASSRFVTFLGQLVGAVNRAGQGKVVAVSIPAAAREVDLRLEGRAYPIKTHMDRPAGQQAQDIARALAWFDQRKVQPQYVDVRVADKAFYK